MESANKNNVLFSLGTPGHLINSLSIIGELEQKGDEFHYHFIDFCRGTISVTGIEAFKLPPRRFSILKVENKDTNLPEKLESILELEFERVFIFHESFIENAFLAAFFKKKGATICLGNDGNRPYYRINRAAIKSKVTETFKFVKTALKNRLPVLPKYIYNLEYGKLCYIDEYWMPFTMKREWAHIKSPIRTYRLLNPRSVQLVKESFINLDKVRNTSFPNQRIIFYMNNILYREKNYQAEIAALEKVKNNIELPLIIKMHPATPAHQQKLFKEVGDYVYCNAVPAEIYMMHIRNSIFLSGWSSSLLYDNQQSCKYYWLYQYMLDQGLPITDLVDFSLPDTHIEHPLQLDEITLL